MEQLYICHKCGWIGFESVLESGVIDWGDGSDKVFFDHECPNCFAQNCEALDDSEVLE